MTLLLLACAGTTDSSDTSAPADTADTAVEVTDYAVNSSLDPDPLVAGETSTFTYSVVDQLGRPIPDLQVTHERVVHVQFVSRDLTSFQHVHEEDFTQLTADDLRNSTFHLPLSVPLAGDYLVVYDFAHHNQYLARDAWLTATGAPAQASAPDTTPVDTVTVSGVTGTLSWSAPAVPGFEAEFTVHLEDTAGEISAANDPLVQYLGADAHLFVATTGLDWATHTHAWYLGMDNVAPGHTMQHVYDGPDLPFHVVFPAAGTYKMWLQFTRVSDPAAVVVLPFVFGVEG